MTVIKTYCDHCGKVLDDMHDCPDIEVGLIEYRKADLCNECFGELEEIICAFVDAQQTEKGGDEHGV